MRRRHTYFADRFEGFQVDMHRRQVEMQRHQIRSDPVVVSPLWEVESSKPLVAKKIQRHPHSGQRCPEMRQQAFLPLRRSAKILNALSQHVIRSLIHKHSTSWACFVNREIFVRGGFLVFAKPGHMSKRSGGELGKSAGFLAGLSTRTRPRIFFDRVALPACAAQDELVSTIFVDLPLDQHEGAEFTIFLICDYHTSTEKPLQSTSSRSRHSHSLRA